MKPKSYDEETRLFREATRGVKPLAHPAKVQGTRPAPRPRVRSTHAAGIRPLETLLRNLPEEPELIAADPTLFVRPGVSQATVRKLRRGQYPVQAELDLHGLSAAQARVQLQDFLASAVERHAGCLRIVHGKGLHSGAQGPVLRTLVNSALRHIPQVLAFASARPVDGGTGAVYVLLDLRP